MAGHWAAMDRGDFRHTRNGDYHGADRAADPVFNCFNGFFPPPSVIKNHQKTVRGQAAKN